jgi:hypothetical protein
MALDKINLNTFKYTCRFDWLKRSKSRCCSAFILTGEAEKEKPANFISSDGIVVVCGME